MPVHRKTSDTTGVTIHTSVGKTVTVPLSALSGTRLEQEAMLIELLQNLLDKKQRRNQLPQDDPDKTTDPGLPWLFWEGTGGQGMLVSREILVVAAPWNEDLQRFDVRLKRNR
jgi:hypothetical protein